MWETVEERTEKLRVEEEIRYVRSETRQMTALQERPEDVVFTGLRVEEAVTEPSPPS